MFRFMTVAMVCLSLAACGATTSGGAGGGMAMSAFDYAPSGATRPAGAHFGYELQGMGDWQGDLAFQAEAGSPVVHFTYTPGEGTGDATQADLAIAMPYLDGGVRRYEGVAADGRAVDVQLQAGPCESGGERYTHFAAVRLGAMAVAGCAYERAAQDRWSNYLMDFMPAIDLCLAEMGDRAMHVSLAYALPGGSTGVRMVDLDNRSWECATREQDTAINSLRPLDAADVVLGEGDPIFVREEMPEFGEGCYVYESVREADGALIGAFGYDACDAAPVAQSTSALTPS